MKQKMISFLLLLLLAPFHAAIANDAQVTFDIHALDEKLDHALVYIGSDAQASIVELGDLLTDHPWSTAFKNLYLDIRDEGNVALYKQVDAIVTECLAVCRELSHDQLRTIQEHLETYQKRLHAGQAHISAANHDDVDQTQITRKCCKKKCKKSAH